MFTVEFERLLIIPKLFPQLCLLEEFHPRMTVVVVQYQNTGSVGSSEGTMWTVGEHPNEQLQARRNGLMATCKSFAMMKRYKLKCSS